MKATAESTRSILGGFTQKIGQLKNSESFRSLEEKVGSAYENVKVEGSALNAFLVLIVELASVGVGTPWTNLSLAFIFEYSNLSIYKNKQNSYSFSLLICKYFETNNNQIWKNAVIYLKLWSANYTYKIL